ncbi:MAG: hypothetical protein DRK00_06525 [Thermoprotei archaeon]|nr:MAG: hypothetical protein DRK00_06525 [Thermoprotei archaeon]
MGRSLRGLQPRGVLDPHAPRVQAGGSVGVRRGGSSQVRGGTPVEVVELKYYDEPDRYSVTQVRIYAWLAARCFECRPKAYLVLGWDERRYKRRLEVEYALQEVEEEIKGLLGGEGS